jgi:hypothetical protein
VELYLGGRRGRWLWAYGAIMGLMGCALPASFGVERGLRELSQKGFVPVESSSQVKAWLKRHDATTGPGSQAILHVYLEGDGAAWWAQRLPPVDPTPRTSVALPLALEDPHASVAYLARPCQFLPASPRPVCPVQWWTGERWGEAAISLTHQALDRLRQDSGARELVLVGHSGGGTLALLAAARRTDVRCVVTIASPLDLQAWTEGQGMSLLSGSLNPADLPVLAGSFQERHLQGDEDLVVPASSIGRYVGRVRPEHVLRVPMQGHSQGWVQRWRSAHRGSTPLATWLGGCMRPD